MYQVSEKTERRTKRAEKVIVVFSISALLAEPSMVLNYLTLSISQQNIVYLVLVMILCMLLKGHILTVTNYAF